MSMRLVYLALAGLAAAGSTVGACGKPAPAPSATIIGQMTFRYYHDLPAASAFYRRLLAIEPEQTPDWVRLFKLPGGATLGLVNATQGSLRPAEDKPVMVSIVVSDRAAVDAWYDRVKALDIPVRQAPKILKLDAARSIYSFMIKDPEGYTVEFLGWIRTAPE